jgi:hypothetical protein
LGACGSSDFGEDVERKASVSGQCPNKSDAAAQAVREVDWHGCDLTGADLTYAT